MQQVHEDYRGEAEEVASCYAAHMKIALLALLLMTATPEDWRKAERQCTAAVQRGTPAEQRAALEALEKVYAETEDQPGQAERWRRLSELKAQVR